MFLQNGLDTFFIMMVGLSGSGKSTTAEKLAEKFDAIIFSSDKIRVELFGDDKNVYDKQHHKLVFEELHKRAIEALKQGKNVIYDATNLNSKNRVDFLLQLDKYHIDCRKFAYLMDVDLQSCLFQNKDRNEVVPPDVIDRQIENFDIPSRFEGFEQVILNSLYSLNKGYEFCQDTYCPKYNRQKYKKIKTILHCFYFFCKFIG